VTDRAEIYWNLHKRLYSIRQHGRVIGHAGAWWLSDVRFAVQPAGRARVLREGRKNVHAFVRGDLGFWYPMPFTPREGWHVDEPWYEVTYNPWANDHFSNKWTGEPYNTATFASGHIEPDGRSVLLAYEPKWTT
jgi:hypothetical protein